VRRSSNARVAWLDPGSPPAHRSVNGIPGEQVQRRILRWLRVREPGCRTRSWRTFRLSKVIPPSSRYYGFWQISDGRAFFTPAEVPNSERANLFARKLRLCSVVCDFSEGGGNDRDKEIKRQVFPPATVSSRSPVARSVDLLLRCCVVGRLCWSWWTTSTAQSSHFKSRSCRKWLPWSFPLPNTEQSHYLWERCHELAALLSRCCMGLRPGGLAEAGAEPGVGRGG
jgi:hypothetical protein